MRETVEAKTFQFSLYFPEVLTKPRHRNISFFDNTCTPNTAISSQ